MEELDLFIELDNINWQLEEYLDFLRNLHTYSFDLMFKEYKNMPELAFDYSLIDIYGIDLREYQQLVSNGFKKINQQQIAEYSKVKEMISSLSLQKKDIITKICLLSYLSKEELTSFISLFNIDLDVSLFGEGLEAFIIIDDEYIVNPILGDNIPPLALSFLKDLVRMHYKEYYSLLEAPARA